MTSETLKHTADEAESTATDSEEEKVDEQPAEESAPTEVGGRDGPDPTRYGDWEKNGRCIDF